MILNSVTLLSTRQEGLLKFLILSLKAQFYEIRSKIEVGMPKYIYIC